LSSDTAFVRIGRPAAEVFEFIADPEKLSLWSFGTWRIEIDETGLIRGTSIKDGSITHVRIIARRDLNLADYLVGTDPDHLTPRIFIRVAEGATFGGKDNESALMMTALRTDGMDDERWATLKTTHAFEVTMIKSALETGYDHRLKQA
jgi:hypothetical protein